MSSLVSRLQKACSITQGFLHAVGPGTCVYDDDDNKTAQCSGPRPEPRPTTHHLPSKAPDEHASFLRERAPTIFQLTELAPRIVRHKPIKHPSPRLSPAQEELTACSASVRHAQLDGVYVSLTSGDPTLWVGVIFIRQGPYAPSILRFRMSFPLGYPSIPPLVTFSTDLFHPLLTPLTTYTYSTGGTDADTVSASDEERLPPGVFSLRHGFPHMFNGAKRVTSTSRNTSDSARPMQSPTYAPASGSPLDSITTENKQRSWTTSRLQKSLCVTEILQYIQSSFCDEAVLDSIPLAAAANPGAFHAWRTHRGTGPILTTPGQTDCSKSANPRSSMSSSKSRRPGQWNWEGVWQERVRRGTKASLSDPVLFAGGPDEIQFLDLDDVGLLRAKKEIEASVGAIQGIH
ncbi:hypothetical protein EJ05DRAFT_486806 [Pseudovirgaria hyperparasitica]|uniref:UBC core domain-containing protein n=1 Tax=Pseudovirgaria hyperparasitica TaxID=470096 RepID=A0A6A6W4E6_9PEZI|nr:uncharacterized protein EJ05DRAFT_486806 [Pseudovirgaria hyperparasitica]KAF2757798.1 hypothetical protein EJ05DRAFT_486806 [Pseudovirgaria hyperparasitica]